MPATLNLSCTTYRTLIVFALVALISAGCQTRNGSGTGFSGNDLDDTNLGDLISGSGGVFGRDPSAVLGTEDAIPGGVTTISVIPGGAGAPNRTNTLESFFGNLLGSGGANGANGTSPFGDINSDAFDPAKNPKIREFVRAFCSSIEADPNDVRKALVMSYYLNVLGRIPSQSEVNSMSSSNSDPVALARTFVKSTEHLTNLVYANYRAFVGRLPTAAEVSRGVEIGRAGSPEDIIVSVLSSEQASKRVRQNNLIFSRQLFIKLLGRRGTTKEVQQIFRRLNQKKVTKQALVREFLAKSDYANNLINSMYRSYVFRAPNASELSSNTNIINTNAQGSAQVQINVLSGDEYRNLWTGHVRNMVRGLCESGLFD